MNTINGNFGNNIPPRTQLRSGREIFEQAIKTARASQLNSAPALQQPIIEAPKVETPQLPNQKPVEAVKKGSFIDIRV